MDVNRVPLCPSTRLATYFMLFMSGVLHYAIRYALNMSIVCMVVPLQQQQQQFDSNASLVVDYETTSPNNNSVLQSQCQYNPGEKKEFGYEGEFYWSRSQVGYILAAFFYAYIPMQVLAGWMADKFGVRHVLATGMLIGGILSLLTPVAARLHYGLLITLRVIMGFSMGVTFPCFHSFIGKWVPSKERGTFFGITFGGGSGGLIVSYLLSGFLCQYDWTYVFYVFGGAAILWYATFLYVVYSSPEEHPRISEREKMYIRESNTSSSNAASQLVRTPWKAILTSPCVLGMCVSHFALVWLFYTVNAGVPLFMQDVMYFKIKENGLLSSLPSVIQMCMGGMVGLLIDTVHRTLITSRRVVRQLAHAIFSFGSGTFVVLVGYMTCQQRSQAIVMFCLIYACFCFIRGSSSCSPSDVAPRLAGTVYGITNLVGNFAGFLVPIAIGNLTPNGSQAEWQVIFFITAGVLAIGWLSYLLLVKAEEQSWARGEATTVTTQAPEEQSMPLSSQDGSNTLSGKTQA